MLVSVIVPAYNEEGNLRRLTDSVVSTLASDLPHPFEVVLVDDDSTDRTPEICDELAEEYDQVRVLHLSGDGGFGTAVKAGLAAANGDVLVPFMGDFSDDPSDIPSLVAAIEDGYDIAYGSRFVAGGSVEGYPLHKLLYNRAYNNLIRLAFGIGARDVTNAFTAYRSEVIDAIGVGNLEAESFDLTAELPLRAHILGFTSTEVPVSWHSRDVGVSQLDATRKGPEYLGRLFTLFVEGNLRGLRDVFGAVTDGGPVRIVGAALLGVLILAGVFSLSGFGEVFGILRDVNVAWMLAGAAAYFGSFLVRTWRYRVLLRTADYLASRVATFRSITFGWFVNFILPARAGDVARGFALKASEGIPTGVAVALVVVERVFDMVVLGSAMVLVGIVFLRAKRAVWLAGGAFVVAALLVVGLLVLYYLDAHVVALLRSRVSSIERGMAALTDALERVASNPYAMALVGLLSVPVWVLEASTIYFSARAVGVDLGAVATVTTAVAAFVAQAIPLTPGGLGTYEATITLVLGIFDVPASTATAVALVDHFLRAALIYVVGAITTVHVGFQARAYFRERRTATDVDESDAEVVSGGGSK